MYLVYLVYTIKITPHRNYVENITYMHEKHTRVKQCNEIESGLTTENTFTVVVRSGATIDSGVSEGQLYELRIIVGWDWTSRYFQRAKLVFGAQIITPKKTAVLCITTEVHRRFSVTWCLFCLGRCLSVNLLAA
jgi:hypothetical protein